MDTAGAVDAQNASTAPWKTAQHAVFHSAHTPPRYQEENEQNKTSTRSTHEIPDSPVVAIARGGNVSIFSIVLAAENA